VPAVTFGAGAGAGVNPADGLPPGGVLGVVTTAGEIGSLVAGATTGTAGFRGTGVGANGDDGGWMVIIGRATGAGLGVTAGRGAVTRLGLMIGGGNLA